jgi:hypothetical protein
MIVTIALAAIVVLTTIGSVFGQGRVIPVCPKATEAEKLVGFQIKLVLPKDTVVYQGHDVDYTYWSINFGQGKTRFQLLGFNGLNVGNGEPDRDDKAASRKFNHRYWRHNKVGGVDSSGTLKNGTLWRNFGMSGEVIWYHNVPADAAAYFDRIIDRACFLN